jgi:hypothetical protein
MVATAGSFVSPLAFWAYVNFLVVPRENKYMQDKFGAEHQRFCDRFRLSSPSFPPPLAHSFSPPPARSYTLACQRLHAVTRQHTCSWDERTKCVGQRVA